MELEQAIALAAALPELAKELKQPVKDVLDSLSMYKEEANSIRNYLADSSVKYYARIYKGLLNEGLPEHAALTITDKQAKQEKDSIKSLNKTKKEKV